MSTITKEVIIEKPGRTVIELDVPADFPVGEAVMILEPKEKEAKHVNRAAEMFGKGKGKVWMSDDFDEPLEDFAEYM